MEITPSSPTVLSGDESLLPGVCVCDFWKWAMGDLRMNSTRGMLAQFLVAKAVGDTRIMDDGWGDFDVLTPDGIKVEVKTSGYLQSWEQRRSSAIVFSGLKGRTWSAASGYGIEQVVRADVFVFAVHTCQDPTAYDALDLSAWDFYVLAGDIIRKCGQKSMNLNRVRSFSGPAIMWNEIDDAVKKAVPI